MSMPQQTSTQNAAMAMMSIDELMGATLRLSDVMNEESTMLMQMRVGDMAKLHDEKNKLSKLLESYQQRMASDPSFVAGLDHKTREELLLLTDDLAVSVEENFRKVAAAKTVNQRILQAIMDVISEQHRPGTYGRNGMAGQSPDLTLSINLNQQA